MNGETVQIEEVALDNIHITLKNALYIQEAFVCHKKHIVS